MKVINLGFIACGWIVEKAHIPSYLRLEHVNIHAVFDTNKQAADAFGKKYGIVHVFDKIEEFLSCGLDAVIIASPNHMHSEYTKLALNKKIHVLCEKPVAFHQKDIEEIIFTAEKNGVVYMPGFVNRFRQDMRTAAQLVQNNEIGEVLHAEAFWIRKSGIPKAGTWFTTRQLSGGGVLVDLGSHLIDLCTMFVNGDVIEEIKLVTVRNYEEMANENAAWFCQKKEHTAMPIDVEKACRACVTYKNKKSMHVSLSWSEDVKNDYTCFVLTGSEKTMVIKTLFGFSTQRLWQEDEILIIEKNQETKKITPDKEKNQAMEAFYELSKYFINEIRLQKSSYLKAEDAMKSVSIIEQLYQHEKVIKKMPDKFYYKETK